MIKKFTLIELVVVILTLSLLAVIVLSNISGIKNKANQTANAVELRTMQQAVDMYYVENGSYPTRLGQPNKYKERLIDNQQLNGMLKDSSKIKRPYYVDYHGTVLDKMNAFELDSNFVIYYDSINPLLKKEIYKTDLAIIEPLYTNSAMIADIKSNGTKVLGYIPITEVGTYDPEFMDMLEETDYVYNHLGEKMKSDSGNAFLLDLTSEHYKSVLLKLMEQRIMEQGYDGLFLDTVSNLNEYLPPDKYEIYRQEYEQVLQRFKEKYPNAYIMQNRGYEVGEEMSHKYINSILWEDFRSTKDSVSSSHRNRIEHLKQLQEGGIQIFAVSVGYKSNEEIKVISDYAKELGYTYYHSQYDDYNTWPFEIKDELQYSEGVASNKDNHVLLGSYVSFGNYNGQPLQWRVIEKNGFGLLLYADDILKNTNGTAIKRAYDVSLNIGEPDYENNSRATNGSNNWENSDIRSWLNSTVYQSAFSNSEKEKINKPLKKVVLARPDLEQRQLGSELLGYNKNITEIVQNYDHAFAKVLSDNMFLPSVKDLYTAYQVLGTDYYSKTNYLWLRDPVANSYSIRYVEYSNGTISNASANLTNISVRPLIYLKSGTLIKGTGTLSDPYKIE